MKRVAVIGAGISGLAAARRATEIAARSGQHLELVVLEASREVGGKARTVERDGFLLEAGPQGYLDQEPSLRRLVADCQLDDELIGSSPTSRRRYVYHQGRFAEITLRPTGFFRGRLLRLRDLARVLREPWIPVRDPREGEESLHDYAARRLGPRVAQNLVAPMALGVFAGDSRQLGVRAAFPRLAALESEHGSVLRGALARQRRPEVDELDSTADRTPRRGLVSFRGGIQVLPRALARSDRFEVRTSSPVEALRREAGGGNDLLVRVHGESLRFDSVIVATEAPVAARLLDSLAPRAAATLRQIETPGAVVVAAAYRREQLPHLPRGFGALIARDQGLRTLGCLWEHQVFAGRAPEGSVLIRSILGGAIDPEVSSLSVEELRSLAHSELGRMTQVQGDPELQEVFVWPEAIPQYDLGHVQKVERVEMELAREPQLYLAGNSLHGVGFSAAAATGWRQGERCASGLVGQAH